MFTIAVIAAVLWAQRKTSSESSPAPRLLLDIVDAVTGKPTAARFSLEVDGRSYAPLTIGINGIRFVSIHQSKQQVYPVTYANGTGPLEVALPPSAREVTVHVCKGFEYLPTTVTRKVAKTRARAWVSLTRWTNLASEGWLSADAHVHYDRLDKKANKAWLKMMEADDLHLAHFMVLKGGQVPGIWAKQYAYGTKGEASDGHRVICAGEEYRDGAQGHINLFGLREIIQPISTGGIGKPVIRYNYPPLHDVLQKSRDRNGFNGIAHGGSLGRAPTAIMDTVLGKVDFFEIANSHLYSVDLWYRLLNCGYHLPPTAGTDLPNYPYRDQWQPFLGSIRTYVKVGNRRDFVSWQKAVSDGRVFVSSGPLLSFQVNQSGPGARLSLPNGEGEVKISAELSSPIGLRSFELIKNGKPVPVRIRKRVKGGVYRWSIQTTLRLKESSWLAARGEGVAIQSLKKLNRPKRPWAQVNTIAHTAPIAVLVGQQPIRSNEDIRALIQQLRQQQEHYRTKGIYEQGQHRLHVVGLFDKAITVLKKRRQP